MMPTAIATHAQGRRGLICGVGWMLRLAAQALIAFAGTVSAPQNPAFDSTWDTEGVDGVPVWKLNVADQSLGAGSIAIIRQK